MLDEAQVGGRIGDGVHELSGPPDIELTREDEVIEALVANSSIQFFDLAITEAAAIATYNRYFECRDPVGEGDAPSLHQVVLDENGVFHHPLTDLVTDPGLTYAVDGRKALDAFAGNWVPLPLMRSRIGRRQAVHLEEGPSNWVRLFIRKDEGEPDAARYSLVLAVDTALEPPSAGASLSATGPSDGDTTAETVFRFSADVNDIGWFVTEQWVDEWLSECFREHRTRVAQEAGQANAPAPASLEHLAHYLTLLSVLSEARILPSVRLLANGPDGETTVPVDLVLDIGNSRSFAMLAEDGGDRPPQMELLPIRELARPWQSHEGIFPSRIEFARAALGKEIYSRWSGRTSAFYWPSIARTGVEAERLGSEQRAPDAFTGVSSPMRYLWDDRPSRHVWRFAGVAAGARRNALISGPLLGHLSESGDVLDPTAKRTPTTKPRFSRSSLLTFLAAELIQHALVAINAPAYRWKGKRNGQARRLARIVLTVPTSMQRGERRIFEQRIGAAVRLVWQAMGWTGEAGANVPLPPTVVVAGEVASNTQLAFLANEITHKFQGNPRSYFELIGRMRSGHGTGRSLRIAALDIGGSTSSLAITTYGLADSASLESVPHLTEGFAIGADDVLKALVETLILPALERQLTLAKLADARQFLRDIVQGATHGRASRLGEFRRRLASDIAMPAAIAILKEHDILRASSDDRPAVRTLGDLLSGARISSQSAIDEFESLASDEGSDGFHCLDVPITFTLGEVAHVIRTAIQPVVAGAVRAIRALDCDVVLLSGWLSRLPVVKETLLDGMPIRPDRIVATHEYRMGAWYPVRSAFGSIEDPKSLPAIGAVLASHRAVRIGGLTLLRKPASGVPSRYVMGRLDANGFVPDENVIFDSERAQSATKAPSAGRQATISVMPPVIIGMRRSPLASWPALPLYVLSFDEISNDAPPRTPIRVTLDWKASDEIGEVVPVISRATDADGIDLASSEISLRLQTLASPDGHWLDTGVFDIA